MDSGQEFTREWLYDVILDQMVHLLQFHGPDAPPGAQVEEGEESEADAGKESEAEEGEESEESEAETGGESDEDAEDGEDAELTGSLSATSLLDTPLQDTVLGHRLARALTGGTGATETRTPLTGASGGAP